ncbi:MAG: hypothetical protein KME26_03245 [Oscillatoria princeps RMCB-10]|nr:hypothetical protein [Oscillatoria princeps RMCB-10]
MKALLTATATGARKADSRWCRHTSAANPPPQEPCNPHTAQLKNLPGLSQKSGANIRSFLTIHPTRVPIFDLAHQGADQFRNCL